MSEPKNIPQVWEMIKATVTEGDRTWIAHGETREEALYCLQAVVNGAIRFGQVKLERVSADPFKPTPDTPSDAPKA